MEIQKPFIPKRGGGQWGTIGSSAQRFTVGEGSDVLCFTAPISNTGVCYVAIGNSTVTATSADYPLLPGSQVSVGKFLDDAYCSLVCPVGSADVQVLPGIGI